MNKDLVIDSKNLRRRLLERANHNPLDRLDADTNDFLMHLEEFISTDGQVGKYSGKKSLREFSASAKR